jgi:hypothetical protein
MIRRLLAILAFWSVFSCLFAAPSAANASKDDSIFLVKIISSCGENPQELTAGIFSSLEEAESYVIKNQDIFDQLGGQKSFADGNLNGIIDSVAVTTEQESKFCTTGIYVNELAPMN